MIIVGELCYLHLQAAVATLQTPAVFCDLCIFQSNALSAVQSQSLSGLGDDVRASVGEGRRLLT